MFVKICGITNVADAQAAIDHGAHALGFIFHPASPRYIAPLALASWIQRIPKHILRVGVFVDRPAVEIEQITRELDLDIAQLHGTETAADIPTDVRVWKAFRIGTELDPAIATFPAEAVLLDGAKSGRAFHWPLARNLNRRVILAGGLNEDNIAEAIEQAQPWGIDACSSLELYPGKKDHARMARFLKACQLILTI